MWCDVYEVVCSVYGMCEVVCGMVCLRSCV